MSFYRDHIYPHLVTALGDPPPIRIIRQQIIPKASGKVLEIGVGPGVNFPLYDSSRVSKVYALEPNLGMSRLAKPQQQRTKLDIEFVDPSGERVPLQDNTVDTIVSTFTFCTIPV
jgi:ubiquinone/menaquinone biosynthesis C-methylase UbiE